MNTLLHRCFLGRPVRTLALGGLAIAAAFAVLAGGPLQAPWQVQSAAAYSYAAAGKEPLIDAREAALTAIGSGDWAAARTAMAEAEDEITYLQEHHVPNLGQHVEKALAEQNEAALRAALAEGFAAEIERRLEGARENLGDFQTSKVLVVKARRFLDAVAADLEPATVKAVEAALDKALAAIGNPGVFGVGAKAADPEAFDAAHAEVKQALGL